MRLTSFVLFAVLAAACSKLSSDYCGSDPCPIDAPMPIDATSGCEDNPGLCTATEACIDDKCLDCNTTADRESVDCTVAGMPVCRADSTCTPCGADAECTSGVCEAGSCIAAAGVVYVATNGTATNGCNLAAPCSTMAQGLGAVGVARRYINVAPGTYRPNMSTDFDTDVIIIIRARGVFFERENNNQIFDVKRGNVTIIGATVRNASGGDDADGIACSNSATLTLREVVIDNNANRGIDAINCDLVIARATISNNRKGAVLLGAGRIVASNAFVFNNGDNTTGVGGMQINASVTGSRIEFSTLRKNTAQIGSPGALLCSGQQITARNNIIYGSSNTNMEVSGAACVHSYSIIGPMNTPAGTEVRTLPVANLGFVDADGITAAAFHITSTSMAKENAQAGSTAADTAVDFDGEARPRTGPRADLGADEID